MKVRLVSQSLSVSHLNFESAKGTLWANWCYPEAICYTGAWTDQSNDMGSALEEESQDLRPHAKDIMDKQAIHCLTTIRLKDQQQHRTIVEE